VRRLRLLWRVVRASRFGRWAAVVNKGMFEGERREYMCMLVKTEDRRGGRGRQLLGHRALSEQAIASGLGVRRLNNRMECE
jgi:hypothetical protein